MVNSLKLQSIKQEINVDVLSDQKAMSASDTTENSF